MPRIRAGALWAARFPAFEKFKLRRRLPAAQLDRYVWMGELGVGPDLGSIDAEDPARKS
jgi:hypothetical protein